MKIFLLGFMGTGKTYWGRLWAQQNKMNFFDLDSAIEKNTGLTIPQLFEQKGEVFFREKEKELLHGFAAEDNFILSTGGGTPCFYDNMHWMNNHGLTIYLDTPLHILSERLVQEKSHRPLIKDLDEEGIKSFIEASMKKRYSFYSQACIILPTESISDNTFTQIKRNYV